MSENEMSDEEREERFFRIIIPHAWAGLLDLIHDVYVRLGEWLEAQATVMQETFGDEVQDVFAGETPPDHDADVVPLFPDEEEEE